MRLALGLKPHQSGVRVTMVHPASAAHEAHVFTWIGWLSEELGYMVRGPKRVFNALQWFRVYGTIPKFDGYMDLYRHFGVVPPTLKPLHSKKRNHLRK